MKTERKQRLGHFLPRTRIQICNCKNIKKIVDLLAVTSETNGSTGRTIALTIPLAGRPMAFRGCTTWFLFCAIAPGLVNAACIDDEDICFFHWTFRNPKASFEVASLIRNRYPRSKYIMLSDGGVDLRTVAQHLNTSYLHENRMFGQGHRSLGQQCWTSPKKGLSTWRGFIGWPGCVNQHSG